MRPLQSTPARFASLGVLGLLVTACSVGEGSGEVESAALYAHQCWGTPPTAENPLVAHGAPFSLQPDFFGANPYMEQLQIVVQRGSDLMEFSDGLEVLVDDVNTILAGIQSPSSVDGGTYEPEGGASDGGTPADGDAGTGGSSSGSPVKWHVTLPIGVHPPGAPTTPPPGDISPVHMSLYLAETCHNENIVLQAVDGYIAFTAIFDGNPDEENAANKLTEATFDVQFGDLSDVPAGDYAGDVPVGLQSRFVGSFRFYFEAGQPAQPFPE